MEFRPQNVQTAPGRKVVGLETLAHPGLLKRLKREGSLQRAFGLLPPESPRIEQARLVSHDEHVVAEPERPAKELMRIKEADQQQGLPPGVEVDGF